MCFPADVWEIADAKASKQLATKRKREASMEADSSDCAVLANEQMEPKIERGVKVLADIYRARAAKLGISAASVTLVCVAVLIVNSFAWSRSALERQCLGHVQHSNRYSNRPCKGKPGANCSYTCNAGYARGGDHVCGANFIYSGGSCEVCAPGTWSSRFTGESDDLKVVVTNLI
eukprot:SAG11_NODE_342_length_10454_cov_11.233079_2_plen_175_part_00